MLIGHRIVLQIFVTLISTDETIDVHSLHGVVSGSTRRTFRREESDDEFSRFESVHNFVDDVTVILFHKVGFKTNVGANILRCYVYRGVALLVQTVHRETHRVEQNSIVDRARYDSRYPCPNYRVVCVVVRRLAELLHHILIEIGHENFQRDVIVVGGCGSGGVVVCRVHVPLFGRYTAENVSRSMWYDVVQECCFVLKLFVNTNLNNQRCS